MSKMDIFEKDTEKHEFQFMKILREHLPKQVIFIAIVVLLVAFVLLNVNNIIAFLGRVIDILMPIIIGWILTYLMAPLYNIVEKFVKHKAKEGKNTKLIKFSKVIATIVCALAVVLIVVALVFLFVPQLYSSIMNFISKSDTYLNNFRIAIENFKSKAENEMTLQYLTQIEDAINKIIKNSSSIDKYDYNIIIKNVLYGFSTSLKVILNGFVAFIVMIYSLNLKTELVNGLKRIIHALMRKDIAQKVIYESKYAHKVFSGFIVGKLLDSLIIGILCYICCAIMKMPYTPLISVIVGVTNVIPFFGPFIGAIPSFIILLLEVPTSWQPYGFLIFILILQQIDGNIIGPKILGDKTGVGSFWVLFSILLFGGLFGFVGMIIAVPLWAIISKLFEEFIVIKLKEKDYPLSVEEYQKLKAYKKELEESAAKKEEIVMAD